MQRRRAADGQAYTADEYRAWYHAAAQTLWDNAPEVRQASDGKWYTDTGLQLCSGTTMYTNAHIWTPMEYCYYYWYSSDSTVWGPRAGIICLGA